MEKMIRKYIGDFKLRKSQKLFKCPYDLIECDELNTLTMTKIDCKNCSRYDKGIRPSKW